MTAARLPQLGSVVWAELADAGGFRKVRPAVVVSPTADVTAGRPVRLVAITTRLPNPLPPDHVLLPWDPRGKARSGLRRRCAAVTSWVATLPAADIQSVVGILPPAVIAEILAKFPSGPPSPSGTSPTSPPAPP